LLKLAKSVRESGTRSKKKNKTVSVLWLFVVLGRPLEARGRAAEGRKEAGKRFNTENRKKKMKNTELQRKERDAFGYGFTP